MSYCILIVDDEELIRQGIRARLDYLGFAFDSILEAEDGNIALSIIEKEQVDIVITDIRMIDMDGLELICRIKPLHPQIQFIILSGYAEFAYAEQAINLGVNAYLLKPISNEQLKKTIEKVIEQIVQLEQNNKIIKLGEKIVRENKEYILEKDLNAILRHPMKGEGVLPTKNIESYFPIKNKKLITVLINIDGESYSLNKFGYQDTKVIRFCIKNIFDEINIKSPKIIINNLSNTNQLFAILSNECGVTLTTEAEQLFSMLQGILWNRMCISISIGISSITSFLSIEGTKEAQEAFQQRVIHGNGNIYFYEDIKLLSGSSLPASELQMLSQYVERNDIGNIQFILNTIFSDEHIQKCNVNYIRVIWVRIIGILLKSTITGFEKEKEMSKAAQLVVDFNELVELSSLKELREYLWTLILDCLETDNNRDINAKNKIQLAIKYIKKHYKEDIAINDLAERFVMSPNYFSSLFKKETGQTTINYIKELRLKKAKEYLAQSAKSVVDIAKEVGYEDSQYFFKVFKKATGQTPLQYRKYQSKL